MALKPSGVIICMAALAIVVCAAQLAQYMLLRGPAAVRRSSAKRLRLEHRAEQHDFWSKHGHINNHPSASKLGVSARDEPGTRRSHGGRKELGAVPAWKPGPRPANASLKWAIFVTPEGFTGDAGRRQRLAIASWKRLVPTPRVVMVGEGAGYTEVAKEYGAEINPNIDLNMMKMPLAGSLIHTATELTDADVSMILNSDVLLTQSFVNAIELLDEEFEHWFLTGARVDLDELPVELEPWSNAYTERAFLDYTDRHGTLHTAGGTDYFAWSNRRLHPGSRVVPLINGRVPPFIRGKSKFDNWIVHEVIAGGHRQVIDGTEAVVAVHINHKYKKASSNVTEDAGFHGHKGSTTFWQLGKTSNWQIFHNVNLAISEGSYQNTLGTTTHTPWKLGTCAGVGNVDEACLLRRKRPGTCLCEHGPFSHATQNDPKSVTIKQYESRKVFRERVIQKCGSVSMDEESTFKIVASVTVNQGKQLGNMEEVEPPAHNVNTTMTDIGDGDDDVKGGQTAPPTAAPTARQTVEVPETPFGLPFTLSQLLVVMPERGHVLLTSAGAGEHMLLMNFVCHLRRHRVYTGLIVAAWDEATYEFGFVMGLPVFFSEPPPEGRVGHRRVHEFDLVRQVLDAGYDVTWADISTVFLQNPLNELNKYASDFAVSSNAKARTQGGGEALNGLFQINQGLYRVRSTPGSIEAMKRVSKVGTDASSDTQHTREPHAMYRVLCGSGGEHRQESSACVSELGGASVVAEFLPGAAYPTSAHVQDWESWRLKGVSAVQFNPHTDLAVRIEALRAAGLWAYTDGLAICSYVGRDEL